MKQKRCLDFRALGILVFLALGAGVFLRFTHLDKKVYWRDETRTSLRLSGYRSSDVKEIFKNSPISVADLRKYQRIRPETGLMSTIQSLAAEDPKHPPGYYVLLRIWAQLSGDSVKAIRSLSAAISLLAFPCLYWLCRELFQSRLAPWIAVALVAVSPVHVLYAQEAREYALWTVTILLSSAALLRAARLQTTRAWRLYALTVALGLYTHTLFVLATVAHGAYVTAIGTQDVHLKRSGPKPIPACLLAMLVGYLVYFPWGVILMQKLPELTRSTFWLNESIEPLHLLQHWAFGFGSVFLDTGGPAVRALYGIHLPWLDLILLPLFPLGGYALYFVYRSTPKQTWLFVWALTGAAFVSLALPDLIWGGRGSTMPRFLIPSYLGLQLAVSYFLAAWIESGKFIQQKIGQSIFGILVVGGLVSCAVSSQADVWWNKRTEADNVRVARLINRSDKPLVIVSESLRSVIGDVMALSYLLDSKARFLLIADSDVPTLPAGLSDVFLYDSAESFPRAVEKMTSYRIESTNTPGLWRLTKS